jgi:hypothetical protein
MKKLILGAVALVSLTYHAVAQTPAAPGSVPVVTPPSVPTPAPLPPSVPTQPSNSKEKAEKHKGDHDKNKGEERAWENHGKKKKDERKGKKEERGERKEERGERKEERGERKEERGERKEERGERKEEQGEHREERGERKVERKEQKVERKEARAEKLDKMKAYLNLSADQESRMSNAIQAFRTGAKAVKENTKLSADQKKAQFDKLVAERNAQLKAILTPEQLAKLAEAQKQGQAQGKGRNGFISDELGEEDLF